MRQRVRALRFCQLDLVAAGKAPIVRAPPPDRAASPARSTSWPARSMPIQDLDAGAAGRWHARHKVVAGHPGSYGWEYLDKGPEAWRIRISKLAATPLPRVLYDTTTVGNGRAEADVVWKLQTRDRDLDSNIIALPPGGTIPTHAGPDLDVLIHVVSGGGRLVTELDSLELAPGGLAVAASAFPPPVRRRPDGLGYLTVHRRRQSLPLAAPSGRENP